MSKRVKCKKCGGRGYIKAHLTYVNGTPYDVRIPCIKCNRAGIVEAA